MPATENRTLMSTFHSSNDWNSRAAVTPRSLWCLIIARTRVRQVDASSIARTSLSSLLIPHCCFNARNISLTETKSRHFSNDSPTRAHSLKTGASATNFPGQDAVQTPTHHRYQSSAFLPRWQETPEPESAFASGSPQGELSKAVPIACLREQFQLLCRSY